MLRVAESFSASDVGRQRRHNEDSHFARAPLFAVADGMGGAQAGEVASRTAVEFFEEGFGETDASPPAERLASLVRAANSRIHELSQLNADQAGMGTTMTAVYVGPEEIVIAHVGDSRAYRLREGELTRLTDDHSLVDELVRQGRLTPEEAYDHPQRSVILRALGPEATVDVDTLIRPAQAGDVYLLCSDGLTTMVHEETVGDLLRGASTLRDAGLALVAAANAAGGRDNITVILFRLEEVGEVAADGDQATVASHPVVSAPAPAGADQPTVPAHPIVKPSAVPGAAPAQDPGQQTAPRRTPAFPGRPVGPAFPDRPDDEEQTIMPPRKGGPSAGASSGAVSVVAGRVRTPTMPRRPSHGFPAASPLQRDTATREVEVVRPPLHPGDGERIPRRPRMPPAQPPRPSRACRARARARRAAPALLALVIVLGLLAAGGYVASTAVYFVATNDRGLVTVYSGLPYTLPGGIHLYSQYYVSAVPASTIAPARRSSLLNHQLRSQGDASDLVRRLELDQISGVAQGR